MNTKIKFLLKNYWILALFILIKMLLQFILVNPVYELHRDEYLYLNQADHFAFGYISVPPFTSLVSKIIYLLGGSIFWIRFFPAFFGAMTILFAWLIVEELGAGLPAKILTSIFLIFSILARINVLFQPNSFDILAWTIVFYFLIKYIKSQHVKWLILLSVITALGLYNKYTIIFLIVGLIAGLVITEQRTILTKKTFYIAIVLCLIIFLPNIIWQIKNHFPVIHHMKALNKSQLVNVNRIDFLFDQVKYGLVGIQTLAAFWALVFYKPFKPYRFIGWTFVSVILLYTLFRAKSYYAIGLYPVLFGLGCVYLEAVLKKWKNVVIPGLAIMSIVIFFGIVKYLMPFQSPSKIIANQGMYEKMGFLRWEDGKNHQLPQDFADMLGWKEIADKTFIAYQMLPKNEIEETLIFCDNYGQTGAINYYNRNKMPEAYAFNTDYIYWLPLLKNIKNVLYIGDKPNDVDIKMFSECKLIGKVENEFAREKGTGIYLLLGASNEFKDKFYHWTDERKKNFDIF